MNRAALLLVALSATGCDCGPPPSCPPGTAANKYYTDGTGKSGHGGDGSGTCHWDCDPVDPAPSATPAAAMAALDAHPPAP